MVSEPAHIERAKLLVRLRALLDVTEPFRSSDPRIETAWHDASDYVRVLDEGLAGDR